MKKNFKYAILSAIALVGAVSFSACSSSEDLEDVNPTYDGKTVKAQFAISIPAYGQTPTRMTDANTQQAGQAFLGITALRLYPYNTSTTRTDGEFEVGGTDAYGGSTVISSGLSDFTAYENTNAQDKWYMDVVVPTTTNAFLVYGKAIKTGSDFAQGKILASYAKTTPSDLFDIGDVPTKITFEQVAISDATAFNSAGSIVLTQLNTIVGASGKLTSSSTDNVSWAAIGAYDEDVATTNGVKTLRDLFVNLTAAPYAGSSRSVKAMLTDLKETLETMSTFNTAGTLVNDIYTKVSNAITAIGTNTFPASIDLPEGAAKLSYAAGTGGAAGTFTFDTSGNVIGSEAGINQGVAKYVYPSELYYRANTPIRVANKEMEATIDDEDWAGVIGLYQATDKTVTSTTRSIALVDPLQYAVGCLDTWVALKSTTLEENTIVSGTGSSAVYQTISIPNGLKLTGVLIGSQDNVKWDFTHPSANGTNVIFDKDIDVNKVDDPDATPAVSYHLTSTSDTHMNYTLVMETKGVEGTISSENNEAVYVALEFENDFGDFCGIDGKLIPENTKFYLVGKLDLNTTKTSGSRKKVFEQDYTTVAKFTINSLKNAYNVVPDLRTPSLELGLSVNLEWKEGLTFTVPLN